MNRNHWRHWIIGIAAVTLVSAALLWAWNTLATLFGAPPAELRHILAFLVAAVSLRALVLRRRPEQHRWNS